MAHGKVCTWFPSLQESHFRALIVRIANFILRLIVRISNFIRGLIVRQANINNTSATPELDQGKPELSLKPYAFLPGREELT